MSFLPLSLPPSSTSHHHPSAPHPPPPTTRSTYPPPPSGAGALHDPFITEACSSPEQICTFKYAFFLLLQIWVQVLGCRFAREAECGSGAVMDLGRGWWNVTVVRRFRRLHLYWTDPNTNLVSFSPSASTHHVASGEEEEEDGALLHLLLLHLLLLIFMASSQHRCVFVGNIPYDATQEQLIEICQEVGPVVSFRLVIDRETGKPKGYGFCEYKDEETALSARRNLQGYQINGRQLRVDFAENDKGTNRDREQGRGGPGLTANVGGPAVHGETVNQQPIGLHIARTAAEVMSAALGGAQFDIHSNQIGVQSQSALAHDPLTLHLAKMSRSQLNEIISEIKVMASQNKELACQLLLSRPQLPKAVFQAQIMLGMVTPQVLQMPNLRMVVGQTSQPSVDEGQLGQRGVVQTLSGLPPLAQNKLQSGLTTQVQDGHVSTITHNPLVPRQLTAHPKTPVQPQIQVQQHPSNREHLGTLSGQSNLMLPSVHPQSSGSLSVRPPIQPATSTYLNQQMLDSLLQHSEQIGSSTMKHSIQMFRPDVSFQLGPSMSSGVSQSISVEGDRSNKVIGDSNWAKRSGFADVPVTNGSSHLLGSSSLPAHLTPKAEVRYSEQQFSQSQLPPDVESSLLQQVLNLTPEQLSSLPPEQQQQIIQLQQTLRGDQMQAS